MDNEKIIFIIGVNGVGKTTLIPELRAILNTKKYEIHDFDERGVPNNADGIWRVSEVNHWISYSKNNINKQTIICGFVKPIELEKLLNKSNLPRKVYLLDISPTNITQRINQRYHNKNENILELFRTTGKTVAEFIKGNIYISEVFRANSLTLGFEKIDTNNKTPQQIAIEIKNTL
jgi:thymidylate kinase